MAKNMSNRWHYYYYMNASSMEMMEMVVVVTDLYEEKVKPHIHIIRNARHHKCSEDVEKSVKVHPENA